MTTLIVVSLALLGALTLANLTAIAAVVRRLSRLEGRGASLVGHGTRTDTGPDDLVGRPVPDLRPATGSDGQQVTRQTLLRAAAVGFFSADCQPCHRQAPEFAQLASRTEVPLVAYVTGAPGDRRDELVALLDGPVLVVGPEAYAAATAFGVTGFPTMLRVDEAGTVTMASFVAQELGLPESAPVR